MDFVEIFNIIRDIIVVLTPFVLLYCAWRSSKKEKKAAADLLLKDKAAEDYLKLKEENERLQQQIEDGIDKERDKQIASLQVDVEELKKSVIKVNKNMEDITVSIEKINGSLNELLNFNQINLQYCQSLSMLITTIGEGIGNTQMNGNFTQAIIDHKKKEQELFSHVCKSSC